MNAGTYGSSRALYVHKRVYYVCEILHMKGGGVNIIGVYLHALARALTPSARKKILSRRLTYSFGINCVCVCVYVCVCVCVSE